MSVLRSIESKIEGLFEGVFGRAFRTNVQPVELARKLAKEMDEHRNVSVSRVYVPNEYTIYLSETDRRKFASYEGSLVGELQEYLTEHAQREGYALITPPRVIVTTDADLAVGEFGIATRVVEPGGEGPRLPGGAVPPTLRPPATVTPLPSEPRPSDTVVYRPEPPATVVEPVPATVVGPVPVPEPVEVVTLTAGADVHTLGAERTVIGRSRECDVRLADTNVSRRHAEVLREGDTWVIVDLGSTNGTEVNGERVTRAQLSDGDRIELGGVPLRFGRRVT